MKKIFFFISLFFFGNLITNATPCEIISGTGKNIGDELKCDSEYFVVIMKNDENITALTKETLGPNYRQSQEVNEVNFANSCEWEYTPGPKEVDIQQYDGTAKEYVNKYNEYLKTILGESLIKVDLPTLNDLKDIGCKFNDNYSYDKTESCVDSPYANQIINGKWWWTRSAYPNDYGRLYIITDTGKIGYGGGCWLVNGIRPIVTISNKVFELKKIITKTDGNGIINVVEEALEGKNVNLEVIPKEGYIIKEIKITDEIGNTIELKDNGFVMPNSNVLIDASFTEIPQPKNITSKIEGNGTINIVEQALEGEKVKLDVVPKEGYTTKEIKVTDELGNIIELKDDEFIMPNSNVVITIIFIEIPKPKTILSKTEGNGTISIVEQAVEGEKVTLNIKPEEGYEIKEIKIIDEMGNDVEVDGNKFIMPNSNVTISVSFEEITENPNTNASNLIIAGLLIVSAFFILIIKSPRNKYKSIKQL